jgi:hypothetical protein
MRPIEIPGFGLAADDGLGDQAGGPYSKEYVGYVYCNPTATIEQLNDVREIAEEELQASDCW